MQSQMRFYNLILILSFATLAFGTYPAPQSQSGVHLDRFDLLNETSGWVLLDRHLFWTTNAGRTWEEIDLPVPTGAGIQDIKFTNSSTGWVLWTSINADGSMDFSLAQTLDHGNSWKNRMLPLFEAGELQAHSEESSMGWFDAQTGWIAVRQASSSNFSLGTLFTTSDGGDTWTRSVLPVANQVSFSGPKTGWAFGEASGNQVFKTQDGGLSWHKVESGLLSTTSANDFQHFPVEHLSPDQAALNVDADFVDVSVIDSQNFVAVVPGTNFIARMRNGKYETMENLDGRSASITALDMVSPEAGWARSVQAKCTTVSSFNNGSVSCTSRTRLLQTGNGGITWQDVRLPLAESDITSTRILEADHRAATNVISNPGNTEVLIGQGFDKCEIPSLSQLQTWWSNSPYRAVNLYIGGISRACSNGALTSSYLEQAYQQGWKFIPTWVGPQAPCTGYTSRMSSDPVTAYSQGVNEADLAVERLAQLGLTYPDKTGSVVYYDIEYYGTNTACRDAVNSFMNGWVSQIHARGNLAGVYGSTLCNTGLSDFLTIANVPDVIWPARWYHNLGEGYYDPNATVWNLGSCIPNTVWADHQRIRQYEGDHDETWGNLTLGIDSNVLDGVVAIPYTLPYVTSITRTDPNPTFEDTVDFLVTFSDAVTDVDVSDFTLNTTGMTDASILTMSGSGNTYLVTVNTGTVNGTIRLDVPDTAVINDIYGTTISHVSFTGGDTYTVFKTMAIFTSTKTYDGWILESSETSNLGGIQNSTGAALRLGDDASDKQYRSFLSFDTSPMPDTAVVTAVTVRFKYGGVSGTNPFTTHGNLVADVRKGTFRNNPTLQLSDYNGAASKSKVLIFTNDMVDDWYSQSFSTIDLLNINLSGVTQFRLRFTRDDNDDRGADYLKIFSGNALLEADRPQLIVEYYVP